MRIHEPRDDCGQDNACLAKPLPELSGKANRGLVWVAAVTLAPLALVVIPPVGRKLFRFGPLHSVLCSAIGFPADLAPTRTMPLRAYGHRRAILSCCRGGGFFRNWGKLGVFIRRFFGPLRSIMLLVTGICGMRQLPFQIANVASADLWATGVLTPGIVTIEWLLATCGWLRLRDAGMSHPAPSGNQSNGVAHRRPGARRLRTLQGERAEHAAALELGRTTATGNHIAGGIADAADRARHAEGGRTRPSGTFLKGTGRARALPAPTTQRPIRQCRFATSSGGMPLPM